MNSNTVQRTFAPFLSRGSRREGASRSTPCSSITLDVGIGVPSLKSGLGARHSSRKSLDVTRPSSESYTLRVNILLHHLPEEVMSTYLHTNRPTRDNKQHRRLIHASSRRLLLLGRVQITPPIRRDEGEKSINSRRHVDKVQK